jgi:site-specific recombinase XerD
MNTQELVDKYLKSLEEAGKSDKTISVYRRYLKLTTNHFGADRDITSILLPQVGKFFKSDAVNKGKNGKDRSEITSRQICRTFRQMMVFALTQKLIENLPMPKAEMERSRKIGIENDKDVQEAREGLNADIEECAQLDG